MACENIDESDVSIGFINTVKLHKEVVNYCENNQWQNKNIFTGFLMMQDFKEPYLGYLNNKTLPFNKVSNAKDKNYDIYIYYSIDYDSSVYNIKNNKDYLLIKRFENGRAWAEIYKKSYRK